jgi:hypothetical protein
MFNKNLKNKKIIGKMKRGYDFMTPYAGRRKISKLHKRNINDCYQI